MSRLFRIGGQLGLALVLGAASAVVVHVVVSQAGICPDRLVAPSRVPEAAPEPAPAPPPGPVSGLVGRAPER